MTLSDDQRTKIEDWLNEHWLGQAKCPAGHDQWSMSPQMSFMPGFVVQGGAPKIAHELGATYVSLTCDQCGYVAFLDARTVLGGAG